MDYSKNNALFTSLTGVSVTNMSSKIKKQWDAEHKKKPLRKRSKKQKPKNKVSKAYRDEYNRYMRSTKWYNTRAKIINLLGNKCNKCGSPENIHVHHRNYSYFGNELECLGSVIVLCKHCHMKLHGR